MKSEDNNSKYPRTICTGSTVILKYAILHLLLKLCTILGSLVIYRILLVTGLKPEELFCFQNKTH